jgi:hypothetical protein
MLEPLPYQPEEPEITETAAEEAEQPEEKPLELPSHLNKPAIDDDAVQMTLEF